MAASDIYPLSSPQGAAIPLDIIKPKNLVKFDFAASTAADVTIPAGYNTCWLYATADCILRFSATNLPNALIAGTNYDLSLFIPAKTPITLVVTPGECSLLGIDASGSLYINDVQQWAGLVLNKQASFG